MDGDGKINYLDPDSDADGIPDATEGTVDTDGDGKPNYLDPDSDADGIPDATEGTIDADGDGKPNYLDPDSDADGIPDATEGSIDTDADGKPNYLDPDSDHDAIPDSVEGTVDTDADGKPNYLDPDSDADAIPDSVEGTIDTDGDGHPNYLDPDSDADGCSDTEEGVSDYLTPGCTPTAATPAPTSEPASRVFGDPHLHFAHGGRADFRGKHGVFYNFLSAPGISLNLMIEEASFTLRKGALLVDGTFFTQAQSTTVLDVCTDCRLILPLMTGPPGRARNSRRRLPIGERVSLGVGAGQGQLGLGCHQRHMRRTPLQVRDDGTERVR